MIGPRAASQKGPAPIKIKTQEPEEKQKQKGVTSPRFVTIAWFQHSKHFIEARAHPSLKCKAGNVLFFKRGGVEFPDIMHESFHLWHATFTPKLVNHPLPRSESLNPSHLQHFVEDFLSKRSSFLEAAIAHHCAILVYQQNFLMWSKYCLTTILRFCKQLWQQSLCKCPKGNNCEPVRDCLFAIWLSASLQSFVPRRPKLPCKQVAPTVGLNRNRRSSINDCRISLSLRVFSVLVWFIVLFARLSSNSEPKANFWQI